MEAASRKPHLQVQGKQTLVTLLRDLAAAYGRGSSYPELARMVQFSQILPEQEIVVTLSQQLTWSHFHAPLPIKDPLARNLYAEMCRSERRDLRSSDVNKATIEPRRCRHDPDRLVDARDRSLE